MVWGYSPRQIAAYLFLADRRHRREQAEALSIAAMGARGEPKAVKRTIMEWGKG